MNQSYGRYGHYGQSQVDVAALVGAVSDAAATTIGTGFAARAGARAAETSAAAQTSIANFQSQAAVAIAGQQSQVEKEKAAQRTKIFLAVVGGLAVVGTLGTVAYVATR